MGEDSQAENFMWKKNHDNLAFTFKIAILFAEFRNQTSIAF